MSLLAAPYVVAGTVSLFLGYKTYNSYYNQPFEYLEIEGFEKDTNIKTQEDKVEPEDKVNQITKKIIIDEVAEKIVKRAIKLPIIMETIKEEEVLEVEPKEPIQITPPNRSNNLRKRKKKNKKKKF